MYRIRYRLVLLLITLFLCHNLSAQSVTTLFQPVADSVQIYLEQFAFGGDLKVSKISTKNGLQITFNNALSAYPFRDEQIDSVYSIIKRNLPTKYNLYKANFKVFSNGYSLEELKSNIFSTDTVRVSQEQLPIIPLVRNISSQSIPTKGLQNRHLALWPSHGYYYNKSEMRWKWQRARYFETIEDLFTQSFVFPFLVPMLENAGANVLLARERDTNANEVIVDNDDKNSNGEYSEIGNWNTSPISGFKKKQFYTQGENPFEMGTARVSKGKENLKVSWIPDIPESGEYAVYISYQSFENSCDNVKYNVYHSGGVTSFEVNQTMGGGTWIYLGTFTFQKGKILNQGVILESESIDLHKVISADAVRFGGGMGNIGRTPDDSSNATDVLPETSGKPRFAEAARYYLQWSGMSSEVYSSKEDDYADDVASRGLWVNALTAGSYLNPDKQGYSIPIDLAFALHSDAGTYSNDSIVGTMAIYTLKNSDGKRTFPNGKDRSIIRDYADMVQTQIVDDIQSLYSKEWNRRQLLDKAYSETKIPDVPSIIIELLSHQNFADMRYGNDPSFKFNVSRAIYKGILKYLAFENGCDYTVQPLPVNSFKCENVNDSMKGLSAKLSWSATIDPLESTANPDSYIVYQMKDGSGWDNGTVVNAQDAIFPIQKGHIYSYKVTAANSGGESFPSEILSIGVIEESARNVLIINNFDRVSAASNFSTPDNTVAGFRDDIDRGVAIGYDNSFVGSQIEFRRDMPWVNDDNSGFGHSLNNYETKRIAGNTFDYPSIHGAAIMASGYNFSSISNESISSTDLSKYDVVDLICGKQVTTKIGSDSLTALKYRVFTDEIQKALSTYSSNGGNIIVSGSNIAFDIWDQEYQYERDSLFDATITKPSKEFVKKILKFDNVGHLAIKDGSVRSVNNVLHFPQGIEVSYTTDYNSERYANEMVDGIAPASKSAYTVFRYVENGVSAGVAYVGDDYCAVSLGFPIESLACQEEIDSVMSAILKLFYR